MCSCKRLSITLFVISFSILLPEVKSQIDDKIELEDLDSTDYWKTEYFLKMLDTSSLDSNYSGKLFHRKYLIDYYIYENSPIAIDTAEIEVKVFFEYINGKKIRSEAFYENNKLREVYNFNSNGLHGEHSKWFKNGQLEQQNFFKNHKFYSSTTYYFENERIRAVSYPVGDEYSGFVSFYRSGNVYYEFYVISASEHIRRHSYYYSNGKLMVRYIEGDGVQEYFELSEEGDTLTKGKIEDAVAFKVGKWMMARSKDCRLLEAYFNDSLANQKVGVWKYYNEDCLLEKEEYYLNGQLLRTKDYSNSKGNNRLKNKKSNRKNKKTTKRKSKK